MLYCLVQLFSYLAITVNVCDAFVTGGNSLIASDIADGKSMSPFQMATEGDWEQTIPDVYHNDPNDTRYSASDWLHNIKSLPRSSILREIRRPVLTIMTWSTVVSFVHHFFRQGGMNKAAQRMCLSSKPHSLLVSALGLLLVFRTNSAYQRFAVSMADTETKIQNLCVLQATLTLCAA